MELELDKEALKYAEKLREYFEERADECLIVVCKACVNGREEVGCKLKISFRHKADQLDAMIQDLRGAGGEDAKD